MAKLIYGSKTVEVSDGEPLQEMAEKIGVLFGCKKGECGTCLSVIKSGMENISPLNQKEKEFGLEYNERLICQCTILCGEVVVEQ